jgi:serine/threonine-protein kinase RsbT
MPREVTRMTNSPEMRVVDLLDPADVPIAVYAAKKLAVEAGFAENDVFLIATAVSELATNVIRYAGRGQATIRLISGDGRKGVEVVVADQGPGIPDIELAMTENYSSRKDSLGLGLSSVNRIMDEFRVTSEPGCGTTILARKWR